MDDLFSDFGIAYDAAFSDFFAAGFELGFDEGDGFPAGAEEAINGGQNEAEGDEGDVGNGEIGRFGKIAGLEVAGVAGIHDHDAGVGERRE